jgi:hypothetical protein
MSINEETLRYLNLDINAISQFSLINPRYFYAVGKQHYLRDTLLLLKTLDSLCMNLSFKSCSKKHYNIIPLTRIIYTDSSELHFLSYLIHPICDRVLYFEKYLNELSPFHVRLIQQDLNALLYVSPREILNKNNSINLKLKKKAINTWKRKLESIEKLNLH